MRVALAQINTTVGDLSGNVARILGAYRQAVQAGADLVVTPELAITGYPPRDLLAKRRFVEDNLRALAEVLSHVGATPLVVGYVERNTQGVGRPYHNAAALIQNSRVVARRYKTLLPSYDVFDEERYFQPAASNEPVELGNVRLGITICEDIWNDGQQVPIRYPSDPLKAFTHAGLQVLINLSASPYHLGKGRLRFERVRSVAQQCGVAVAYCNLVGGNDELVFDGRSMLVDASGRLLAQGAAFREDVVVVDLDRAQPIAFESLPAVAALHDALVLGLRDYADKCGFRSAVLGLSGGIDSAVTACLAVEAFGADHVLGVSLPSPYSSPGSVTDARALAQNLGIHWELVPIDRVFAVMKETLQPLFAGRPEDTTEENIQARIRGTILMAISNKFGHLLLTTGNKSELAVGYCTLYGDMAGGLAVIADVPKTMVYQLAHYINRQREIIPAASLTKAPSAELRPNQTDQDTLPPYPVLDDILKRYIEESKSAAEIVAETGYDEKLVRDVVRRIDLNEYKRKQAPPCLRVTTKAFGIGRRVPIAQRYVER